MDPKSPHRIEMSAAFLEKLYGIGLIPTKWNLGKQKNYTKFVLAYLYIYYMRNSTFLKYLNGDIENAYRDTYFVVNI